MSDIVKRLRNGTTPGTDLRWSVTDIHREAADEIERLRALTEWRDIKNAPLAQFVILWWVGEHRAEYPDGPAPPTACIGQVSIHSPNGQTHPIEPQFVWDGHDYRPIKWFTHWLPLPPPPVKK